MPRKPASEKEIVVSAPVSARHKPATSRGKRSVSARATAAVVPSAAETPSHEQIAKLAYSYWEARGFQGGSPEEDWLRAEHELAVKPELAAAAGA